MNRAYKFRAYPTKEQEQKMLGLLELHRSLYNSALEERKRFYEAEGKSLTYPQQAKQLTLARKIKDSFSEANCSSCQRTLKRLDKAFKTFFRRLQSGEKPGYPRFRGVGRFNSVDFTVGDGAKFASGAKTRLQGVGDVKLNLHREVEGEIKTISFR